MKETGILFTGESVRAMQDGRKTMTRRTYGLEWVNFDPDAYRFLRMEGNLAVFEQLGFCMTQIEPRIPRQSLPKKDTVEGESVCFYIRCPYGQVGDRLWVRESFRMIDDYGSIATIYFPSTDEQFYLEPLTANQIEWMRAYNNYKPCKIPSIHMPKWAARMWREITEIRAERLQDITEEDCIAEGIAMSKLGTRFMFFFTGKAWVNSATDAYRSLWDSLNAKRGYPWESNCWVWVISFKRMDKKLA